MKIQLEENYDKKTAVRWIGGIFALCGAVFLLFLFFWSQRIRPVDVSGCQIDNGQMVYKIEKTYGEEFIKLEGYAYVPGQSIDYADIRVVAYNPVKDKYYELPTECTINKKRTKKEDDGFNYDNCGFSSVVLADKVEKGTKFFIRCCHNGKDILLDTGEEFNH